MQPIWNIFMAIGGIGVLIFILVAYIKKDEYEFYRTMDESGWLIFAMIVIGAVGLMGTFFPRIYPIMNFFFETIKNDNVAKWGIVLMAVSGLIPFCFSFVAYLSNPCTFGPFGVDYRCSKEDEKGLEFLGAAFMYVMQGGVIIGVLMVVFGIVRSIV